MNRRELLIGALAVPAAAVLRPERHAAASHPLDEPSGVIRPSDIAPWKVNQAGYLPGAAKRAMLTLRPPAVAFELTPAESDMPVYRGRLAPQRRDQDSGDWVQEAEFSQFQRSGRFRLRADGAAASFPFAIGAGVYEPVFRLAARFFYGQRCGTAVAMGGRFSAYHHPPCHLRAGYDSSSGRTGANHDLGGWHDAGDYGRYVVNGGITTATLMWAAEMFPAVRRAGLDIPESGGDAPDLLLEARWNLEWMLSLQDRDGGVWQKQTSRVFAPFVMPQDDRMTSYVIGTGAAPYKSTGATADMGAAAAIAARLWREFDPPFARRCETSALAAWRWLRRFPAVTFRNPPGIHTGEYGDRQLGDERLWAAAEIWRATGNEECHAYFREHYAAYAAHLPRLSPPSWGEVAALGLWSYALAGKSRGPRPEPAVAAAIEEATARAADAIVERTAGNGYRIPLRARDYVWGSNGIAANDAMQLLIAHRLHPRPAYAETALETLHYLLGRNTFSLCYLTSAGSRAVQRPHHRPSVADGLAAPWPGMLAGGPDRWRQDAAMQKFLPANLPPARNYIDNHAAYSCNEVAINWNAALVFVLAANLRDG